ncbi:MAG: DinB family protein [Chloroflexi bacterium]|nr:DinB family protein [Chloroflexota bacterium]MBK6710728.1 DinB family protein [Chloroflexota bacterium]MBK7179693.1 DinB family protein [Chloroflexota bacterium]MBK7917352.1 DinB family protein [Chloroflexota bacterium]MBK8933139.1 DinB family protein [Chloroflexota bacterium]
MPHPLVEQLRFTRSEFRRGLAGLSDVDACQRLLPMNCISWNIGHLAWQEQRYWLVYGQNKLLLPDIDAQFAYGAPASTPPLAGMWQAWETIATAADPWLDTLTTADLQKQVVRDGQVTSFIFGSLFQRMIYHYWYHTGENMAIRQGLGHGRLPQFVGNLDDEAPYRPE